MKYRSNFLLSLILVVNSFVLLSQTHIETYNAPPQWISKKPISYDKYVGIGMAEKNSANNYQSEAKKNALFDLSSDIKIDISTNSVLHTVQNNNKFNESYNSLIKISNHDNIEGYRLVDTYENEKFYWVYYELDKKEYENIKIKNRKIAIDKAVSLINFSFADEKNGLFLPSLKKRIKAFSILLPYINEDIKLSSELKINSALDLSSIIQEQLQAISLAKNVSSFEIIPYQINYKPLVFSVLINNKTILSDFPFIIKSNNDHIRIEEYASSNYQGSLAIQVKHAKANIQEVTFSLFPDIFTLMVNDSISNSSVNILKQFIQIPQLTIRSIIRPLSIFITSSEKNMTSPLVSKMIAPIVENKFRGSEVKLVETIEQSDFVIEIQSDTYKDLSSDILNKNYGVVLAGLHVTLLLRNKLTKEQIFKTEINDVYGYANTFEIAGLNTYSNSRLQTKLMESLFFLKRKIVVF